MDTQNQNAKKARRPLRSRFKSFLGLDRAPSRRDGENKSHTPTPKSTNPLPNLQQTRTGDPVASVSQPAAAPEASPSPAQSQPGPNAQPGPSHSSPKPIVNTDTTVSHPCKPVSPQVSIASRDASLHSAQPLSEPNANSAASCSLLTPKTASQKSQLSLGGPQLDPAYVIKCSSLWEKARSIAETKLSKKELRYLENSSSVQDVLKASELCQASIHKKGWNRLGEFLKTIDKLVATVPIQHHPEFTALVWGGVRFVLLVLQTHAEFPECLELALSTMVEKVAFCEFYGRIYAEGLKISLDSPATSKAFNDKWDSALPEFHAAVLVFLVKAIGYFDPSTSGPSKLKSDFEFRFGIKPLLEDISEKEKAVRECAEMANMERVKSYSSDLQQMLEDIKQFRMQLEKLDDILNATERNLSASMEIKEMLHRLESQQRQKLFLADDLDSNLLRLRNDYLEQLEDIEAFKLDLYLPVEGMPNPHASETEYFDLFTAVQEFLKDNRRKVCLIQGQAGSGKSTFNHHLARMMWKEYEGRQNTPSHAAIPVFISLASLYRQEGDLIAAFFQEEGFSEDHINMARQTCHFVFILDGFDEIDRRDRNFYVSNKLNKWKAKVVVSSRPEYLPSGYKSLFHPRGQPLLLQEYWLAPFSTAMIQEYIKKYIAANPPGRTIEDYQQWVSQPDVRALISNPFLLRMTMTVAPTRLEGQARNAPLTRGILYQEFISQWFNGAQERLYSVRISETQRAIFGRLCDSIEGFCSRVERFCEDFALELYRHKSLAGTYERPWSRFLTNDDEEARILRFSSPLIREQLREQCTFRFLHKSLRDYFIAQALWQDKSLLHCEQSSLINELYIVNDPGVIDFVVDRAQRDNELQRKLLAFVEESKISSTLTQAAANSITILVKLGMTFREHDLRGVQIPGADLSFGWFEGAQLQRADLRRVQLRGAWLRRVRFGKARMDGIEFGELPFLDIQCPVITLKYLPNSKFLAIGYDDSPNIGLWSISDAKLIHTFQGHESYVRSIDLSSDGQLLASGSDDKTVRLWSVPDKKLIHTFQGHAGYVQSIDLSSDSQLLASGSSDKTVRLWSVPDKKLIHIFQGHAGYVLSVGFSPDGQLLASGSKDKTMRLWSVLDKESTHIFQGHKGYVQSIDFSPNGQLLASGSNDKSVRLWSVPDKKLIHIFQGHASSVQSIDFSRDGQLLASGSDDKTVRLWSVPDKELIHTFQGHASSVQSIDFSPDGQLLASGSIDKTVRLWLAPDKKLIHTFQGHAGYVLSVDFSPDGRLLASSSDDKTVRLWSVANKELIHTFQGHVGDVQSINFSPDGQLLASGSNDNTIRLWSIPDKELIHTFQGHVGDVLSVGFSPDGQLLASGSDEKTLQLWSVPDKKLIHTLQGHAEYVRSIDFSPDGQLLASSSMDKAVWLWSVPDKKLIHTFHGHEDYVLSVAFSPDGQLLASGSSDKSVRLWSIPEKKLIHTFQGHAEYVRSIDFSHDGQLLASGSDDKTVRLWSVGSQKLIAEINVGHDINSVCWNKSDGEILAVGAVTPLRLYRIKRIGPDSNWPQLEIALDWASENVLDLEDAIIDGVTGLDNMNIRLLKQHGAIGEPDTG